MKHKILLSYACCLLGLASSAAVPLRWTVDMRHAQPATFEAYQGETLDIKAALMLDGKPFEAPSNYSFFWQTNGMGRYYWEAPCSRGGDIPVAATNVLFATWLPAYDVGAKVYKCFIGSPSNNYHSAFQLRLTPSPGATPNVLPLPTPVIDFAKVRVLNPPWEGGGGGGVNTNAVRDIAREEIAPATNRLYKTLIDAKDGAARPLPRYLHALDFDDSYPEAAAMYYKWRSGIPSASCSAVRDGNFLYRNFDYPFDDRAEFIVRVSSRGGDIPVADRRYASVGVAQVDTNLTEQIVTSGKPSRWYKALPGATVDGINENGVVAEINVVDGPPQWRSGIPSASQIHPLAAVRWALDNGTSAAMVASNLAARIAFPSGWTQNFHYMIADAENTYIVENGTATDGDEYHEPDEPVTMTNFQLSKFPWDGMGMERFGLLLGGENITNAWFTNAYRRETNPPWVSDLADVLDYTNAIFDAWASHPKEYFRNSSLIPHTSSLTWWQTVHTSIYDISNRTLRVAVQEVDDWYTFAVPSAGGGIKEETDPTATAKANAAIEAAGCVTNNQTLVGKHLSFMESVSAEDDGYTEYTTAGITTKFLGSKFYHGSYTYHMPWDFWYQYMPDNRKIPLMSDIPDVSCFVPYTGAMNNVDLGDYRILAGAAEAEYFYADGDTGYAKDFIWRLSTNFYFPWASGYADKKSNNTFALVSQIEDATNGLVSASNPAFSNAVDTIVRSIMPTKLRAYDPVRQCWWNIQPVNGVLTLTVED